ncbi:MAG TPA: DISARM system helicase DrmA [Terriglobales bacterium]|nr:DISARM system helicase DrmA [Terriglobales bacterium]
MNTPTIPISSVDVRGKLVDALRLDLVGPSDTLGDRNEVLPQAPSRWYLSGFLVPLGADQSQRASEDSAEDLDQAGESGGADDDEEPERPAARQRYLPSSIGVSVLVPAATKQLAVTVSWGDYRRRSEGKEEWERIPRQETVAIDLARATEQTQQSREVEVPKSSGVMIAYLSRKVGALGKDAGVPADARAVSVFVVNRRAPKPDEKKDEAFLFQVALEVKSEAEFLCRPDLRGLASDEWDERIADLQYRDVREYAVGHNVATEITLDAQGDCRAVRTCWIPQAEVERVAPAGITGVELGMDDLSKLADAAEARNKLLPLAMRYRAWIAAQAEAIAALPERKQETAQILLNSAKVAAQRIEDGISLLADQPCLDAFRLANKCMADAARRRLMIQRQNPNDPPAWRPFQLAFLLMNLKGIALPENADRNIVDLLFFPTGGGKTEAYLGLSAFTLLLRRLRNSGIASAGLTVLMRYTLRLLTLDQLSRASTLICALELERQKDAARLGDWPFEIGLWVGRAATPNRMGKKGDKDQETARARTIRFLNDDRKPSPIPLEECPWCGTKFKPISFRLLPNNDNPIDLRISCANRECPFGRGVALPIVAVDEPIYRRLPCFMIATVDKFAALPWTGEVGAFFGRVERHDKDGFYGPCEPDRGQKLPQGRLLPPDLIIQDELHLISGPLGTMVGLYESALDELCAIERNGHIVRPKIIASTATVRRAETQIRALFNRKAVEVFPPPGPDRRDSFFARTLPSSVNNARLYVGVAAQGRSPKVAMLRVYLALLGAGQRWYSAVDQNGKENAADPYMTLVGYFNSLRELGGARRLIEDEVRSKLEQYSDRMRVGESQGLFADRKIDYDPVELTSRVDTAQVADAKRRLARSFAEKKERVDVAIATNMISVGLDIIRLGLMVVFGQPKASAEYIQATSRVGRDDKRPGLVVTIFNVHKPRDRSHYERFTHYHQTFYRSVEATSVTPFSPRALDKALAATLVGLVRQVHKPMTPAIGAMKILEERQKLESVITSLADRAFEHSKDLPKTELENLRSRVRERALALIDDWSKLAKELQQVGTGLQYNPMEAGAARQLLYDYLSPELKNLPPTNVKMKFRAMRSLRDVEPEVSLWVRTLQGGELEEETVG